MRHVRISAVTNLISSVSVTHLRVNLITAIRRKKSGDKSGSALYTAFFQFGR